MLEYKYIFIKEQCMCVSSAETSELNSTCAEFKIIFQLNYLDIGIN
jgi:hypothetical protein